MDLQTPLLNDQPSLADFLAQTRARQLEEATRHKARLSFLNRLGNKPKTPPHLPSGLTVEEAADLSNALAKALRRLGRTGRQLNSSVQATDIQVTRHEEGYQTEFDRKVSEVGQASTAQEQKQLAGLFYSLLADQPTFNPNLKPDDLTKLGQTFPETALVLEKALEGRYSSAGEMAGAFGWSLYSREQIRQMPALPRQTRQKEAAKAAPVVVAEETANRSDGTTGGFSAVTAWASLAIAMVLLVIFIVYSVVSSSDQAQQQARNLVTPEPTAHPLPTVPGLLQNSRLADGSNLTRYQPAWAGSTEIKYRSPADLAPGEVTSLNGPRAVKLNSTLWSPGQNLYLSTQDGGWEVWDIPSKSRISRRELPNPDQYLQVSWSPDGDNFAAFGLDGQLKLGSSGKVLRSIPLRNGAGQIYTLQNFITFTNLFNWSPNSNYLLLRTDYDVYQLWSFKGGPQQINSTESDTAKRFNQATTASARVFPVPSFSWSGDSNYLALALDDKYQIVIFQTKDLSPYTTLELPTSIRLTDNGSIALAWSPDSRSMALFKVNLSGGNGVKFEIKNSTLTIWQLPAIEGLKRVEADPPVKITDVQSIELKNLYFNNLNSDTRILEWSRDGQLLVGALQLSDNTSNNGLSSILQVYEPDTDKPNSYKLQGQVVQFDKSELIYAHWSPNSQTILVNDDRGAVKLVPAPRPVTGDRPVEVLYPGQTEHTISWLPSPDGKMAAQTGQVLSTVLIKDTATNRQLASLDGPESMKNPRSINIKWSPDSQYLAARFLKFYTSNNTPPPDRRYEWVVRVWKFENGQPAFLGDYLLPNDADTNPFDWSNKSTTPAIFFQIGNAQIGQWDLTKPPPSLEDQRKLKWIINKAGPDVPQAPAEAHLPYSVVGQVGLGTITTNGQSLNNDYGNNILWSPGWKMEINTFSGGNGLPFMLLYKTYSGNAALAPAPVALDPRPGTGQGYSGDNAFSPDGRLLAIGLPTGLINVYETDQGKLVQSWSAHQGMVTSLRWSPDGKNLASGGADHVVRVWDTVNWHATQVLRGTNEPISGLIWLGDNRSLVVKTSIGDSLLLWKIK